MSTYIHATGIVSKVRLIETKTGKPMTVASLETGHDGGQRLFFNVKAFDENATKLADVRNGAVLTVQGSFSKSSYERDGQKRWSDDITVTALLAGFVPQSAPEEGR